jgi:cysteine-rich repeat protein
MALRQRSLNYVSLLILLAGACGGDNKTVSENDAGSQQVEDTSTAGVGGKQTSNADAASSTCGNGILEGTEECDDGNAVENDGCTLCEYDCTDNSDCTGQSDDCIEGATICNPATHACTGSGEKKPDGTKCGDSDVCRDGVCVSPGCGNGATDKGEECDDGNTDNKDGCTNKCRYTCVPTDKTRNCAQDCNPTAACSAKTHTCSAGSVAADGVSCQDGKGVCQDGSCVLSSSNDAGPSCPNCVQRGQLCDRLSTIQCNGERKCCTTSEIAFASFDDCKKKMKLSCQNDVFIDKISLMPVIGFDDKYAPKAFDEFEAKADACDPKIVLWSTSPTGLRGILKGTLEPKSACAPLNITDPAQIGAALLACIDGPNYACLATASGWTCEQPNGEGGRCFFDTNCTDGLYCVLPGLSPLDPKAFDGVCTKRKANGESCETANQCETLACFKSKCVPNDVQTAYCLNK